MNWQDKGYLLSKNKYNENNYAEVVKVTFNNNAITLEEILKHFFETHDPTQLNRQGNDIGTQYRSTILFSNENQKNIASEIICATLLQFFSLVSYFFPTICFC